MERNFGGCDAPRQERDYSTHESTLSDRIIVCWCSHTRCAEGVTVKEVSDSKVAKKSRAGLLDEQEERIRPDRRGPCLHK